MGDQAKRTFILEDFEMPVEVTLTPNITKEQLLNFPAFNSWMNTLRTNLALQHTDSDHIFHSSPHLLYKIEIQSVDWFGQRTIGFIKLKADIGTHWTHGTIPGITFLRGGSVAVLVILRPQDSRDERWVILVEQPRVPTGSLGFVEIPAGMFDHEGNFAGRSAMEIREELGVKIRETDLVNLTELALKHSKPTGETLKNAMYLSPSGSDDFVSVFLWEKELYRQEIMDLRGKLEGTRTRGEMVTVRICDYEEIWKVCPRDAKTLAAWALYEGLNRAGIIQEELRNRKKILSTSEIGSDIGLSFGS